jgi:kumamolisin
MGDMPAADTMSVAVSLNLRDETGLQNFLTALNDPNSPQYHQYLTPAEFTAQYGPTTTDVQEVTNYLTATGLTVSDVSNNRQVIDVTGPVSTMEQAFDTHMSNYMENGREFYANDIAPALPADIAGMVAGLSGLDDHAVRHAMATRQPRAQAGFTPTQLQTAYNTTQLGNASGQTVALWEFDGYQASNIASYDTQFGINASTPRTVSVDGANFDQRPGQGEGEVELDIELVQAMANAANTLVYEAPNSDQGQIDMANKIVSDDKVSVTSISWGSCEAASAPATITSTDNALKQGAAEGISFYAASGDSGSNDCGNGNAAVDYPASDPNVTGVGGTSLTTGNNGAYQNEAAWTGSGGGVSAVFGAPTYQGTGNGMRTVPDVSSDADPNTGYAIFSAGQWQVFGGTSCAAPMWAGFTALFDAKAGTNLGNGNTKFYAIGNGANYGTAFHDVSTGNNGGFQAGTGYDDVTGWGSYDGAGLASALG